jgi:NAD(P)-dependent dehydrogenase (short-subunit alcohol dehydrogenase family)
MSGVDPRASDDRCVAVTGSTRGIGRAIALDLAAHGWRLLITGRDRQRLENIREECVEQGAATHAVGLDVRSAAAVADAFEEAESVLGPIAALVNNAGAQHVGPALQLSPEQLDDIIDTNLKGCFNCSQAFARRLIDAGRPGVVLNIASAAALVGTTERAAYAASKAGVVMLTRTFAREWAPHRVRVNAIAPTFVDTELGRQTLADPERRHAVERAIPLGRIATYDDILPAVRYLLDEAASGFVTGQVIAIDGGLSA